MKTLVSTFLLCLFSFSALAQTDTLFQSVTDRLHYFSSHAPSEKIYVHQDRTSYVAGETMWFKIYQSSLHEKVESGIVYVELIDGNNETVVETKWPLENFAGSGHIELPNTLKKGIYQLRAYTNWMQNKYPHGYFTREIQITSQHTDKWEIETDFSLVGYKLTVALRFLSTPDQSLKYFLRLNGKNSRSRSFNLDEEGEALLEIDLPEKTDWDGPQFFVVEIGKEIREFPIPSSANVQLTLFPEGGNLVEGLPSKVAFKVTDREGKGLEASGTIVDDQGQIVRQFQTSYDGNGYFLLQPSVGRKYTARLDNSFVRAELPQAYSSGIVMGMKRWEDNMRITLMDNSDPADIPSPLYLTIHQDGESYFNAFIEKGEEITPFDIPLEKLPIGIFTITIYDSNYKAYCERLAFLNYPEPLPITMKTVQPKYGTRQQAIVELETDNVVDLSLAVIKAGLDDVQTRNNYYTDYFLRSELIGRIDNPVYYLENRDTVSWNHLDLLLLTHGWRRYAWEDMMHDSYPDQSFPVEESLSFAGRTYALSKKQAMEDIHLAAHFQHDSIDEVVSFHPGENGTFKFSGYHFTDTAKVVLSSIDKHSNVLDISIDNHASFPSNFYTYGKEISKAKNDSLFVELGGANIQHVVKDIDKTIFELPEVQVTSKRKTKHAQYSRLHNEAFNRATYITDKNRSYGRSAMNILMYVPGIRVRQQGVGEWIVSMGMSSAKVGDSSYVTEAPQTSDEPKFGGGGGTTIIFVLNGTLVDGASIAELPPSLIERVEILDTSSAMVYASGFASGGVAFYTNTYQGRLNTPTKTVTYKFPGFNQPKEFFRPNYAVANKDFVDPDHRNTIHWQPEVVFDEDGKAQISFFTSDDKGEYLIHCEGHAEDGQIGTAYTTFVID